jgi:predicted secreted protein
MVNNFNIGYQISQAAHPVCGTAAATDIDALSETGRALANSLTRATLDEARLP